MKASAGTAGMTVESRERGEERHRVVDLARDLPRGTGRVLDRLIEGLRGEDRMHAAFLTRALTALLVAERELDGRALGEIVSAPSDYDVLLRFLEAPAVLGALSAQDPLAAARVRGARQVREILQEEGGTVGAGEMGELLGGISAQAVDKRRRKGKLLALPAGKGGYRYPVWQVRGGTVIEGFEEVLAVFGVEDPWMRAAFFLSGDARLGGDRPLDRLNRGDVEDVEQAAAAYGVHGAD